MDKMKKENYMDDNKKFKIPSMRVNLHIILLVVILLIAIIAVYRLYKWNQGTDLDTDVSDVDPSEFDIETLDMIIPMDASLLEGREDDGVTTILCLGNNPFTDDRDTTGLAAQIASKTGAVVYDCAFPDSSAACKYPMYNPEYTKDHFNFFYVVECFRNNEFRAISSIAGDEPDPRYTEAVGTPSDNPKNPNDVTAFTGGLRTTLQNIQSTWPHIRILVMSPTYARFMDEDGELYNGTMKDIGNGTLNHYLVLSLTIITAPSTKITMNSTCPTICITMKPGASFWRRGCRISSIISLER